MNILFHFVFMKSFLVFLTLWFLFVLRHNVPLLVIIHRYKFSYLDGNLKGKSCLKCFIKKIENNAGEKAPEILHFSSQFA